MATLAIVVGSTTYNLPEPQSYVWTIQDIDSTYSGRNISGTMIRDRVATKRKLQVSWSGKNGSDAVDILSRVSSNPTFTLRYFDALTNSTRQSTFYVGDRQAKMYWLTSGNPLWETISYNFIEV